MHQVTGDYPDYGKHRDKSSFYLNADKGFIFFEWSPPIHWEGMVGGIQVKFTQISHSGSHRIDYDWAGFPAEVSSAIPYIVEAIDKAMKVMD